MKLIKRLVLVAVVLLIVVVVAVGFFIDAIAKTGVEEGASYAMEVPTKLKSANVRVFAGGFGMNGLHVANPKGYDADYFLTLGNSDVNVSLNTLMQDTVVLPTLHLEDLSIVLEKKDGKTNLDTIMASIGRLSSGEPAAEGGKRFIVNEIVIRNVELRVIMAPVGTANKPLVVTVPEIRLTDVGSDTPNGVVLSQLTGTIVSATLRAIATNAPDVLGNVVVASIDGALTLAGDLGKVGGEIIGQATQVGAEAVKVVGDVAKEGAKVLETGQKALDEITKGAASGETIKDVGSQLEGAGKKLEEAGKGLGDALKGLGGRKKDDE